MSGYRLSPRQERAASHLADAIIGGYTATLTRDSQVFAQAVAESLAAKTGRTVAAATIELIERHKALLDWPEDAEIAAPKDERFSLRHLFRDPKRAARYEDFVRRQHHQQGGGEDV